MFLLGGLTAVELSFIIAMAIWLALKSYSRFCGDKVTTNLRGPQSKNVMFGVARQIMESEDPGSIYEEWSNHYGKVYAAPHHLGRKKVVLCDLKAVGHFLSKETFTFVRSNQTRNGINRFLGKGLISAEGDDHKRQRKALSPAFSNAAIRHHTNVFYDNAYKVKSMWENIIQDNMDVIEVQEWHVHTFYNIVRTSYAHGLRMNHVALDSVGLAGFSHNFNCLEGERQPVVRVFEAFQNEKRSALDIGLLLLRQIMPLARHIPSEIGKNLTNFRKASTEIAHELLDRARKERDGSGGADNSIIGCLVKSENHGLPELRSTPEEVIAQMNVLIIAGFETSSTTLTWALIELCKDLKTQAKLRAEFEQFRDRDPTWDHLMSSSALPYLDAVVQETLRLHTPVPEIQRVAAKDDIIPLSEPLLTADGKSVSSVTVAKGTVVNTSLSMINRSFELWGSDAKQFIPERWLKFEETDLKAKEILGYRHILTFSDGPRICIGRQFALAEIKAVLSVLIRNFTFELPNGPEHKVFLHHGFMKRPRLEGSEGARTPLIVRRVE